MATTSFSLLQRFKQLSRPQRLAVYLVSAFVLYCFVGFLVLPPIIKVTLGKKLPPTLHRNVSVTKIRLNPLTLSATIEGLGVFKKEAPGQLLSVESLTVNLQAISLFKRALVIKSVTILTPMVNFSRTGESIYSFSDLLPKRKDSEPPKDAKPFLFSINNIVIKNGDIHFSDQPKEKKHHVADLNLAVASISNLPYDIDHFVQPAFSAVINGTPFSLGGLAKPFANSRETDLNIDITNLNIEEYLAYLPNPTQATLTSCLVDVKGKLAFARTQDDEVTAKLSYSGQLIFKDTTVTVPNGDQINFPKIAIIFAESNLLAKHVHISSLGISAPDFTIRRTKDLQILPLAYLLPPPEDNSPAPPSESSEDPVPGQEQNRFRLDIDALLINKAHINFQDSHVENFETTVAPLTFQATGFSTMAGASAKFNLQLQTESAEAISSSGELQLFPSLSGKVAVTVDNITVPKYMPYAHTFITPEINSGTLDVSSDFTFAETSDNNLEALVSNINIALTDLTVTDKGEPVLVLPTIALNKGSINLVDQTIHVEKVNSKDLVFTVVKDRTGNINIDSFAKKSEPGGTKQTHMHDEAEASADKTRTPWTFSLDTAQFKNYEFVFIDQSLESPVELDARTEITVSRLSSSGPPAQVDLVARMNTDKGEIKATGTLGLSPLAADLKTDIKTLAFEPFQSYVSEHFNLRITGGSLSSQGEVSLIRDAGKSPTVTFSGNSSVDDFTTRDTLVKDDLVSWKKLNLAEISFTSAPMTLNIQTIHWDEPHAKIFISDNGTLSFLEISKKSNTHDDTEDNQPIESPPTNSTDQPRITIHKFAIADANFDFMDYKIQPTYSASLSALNGEITGLSSAPEAKADLLFAGKLNQSSPLKISGSVNPLSEKLFADLFIDFHDIDLSPASPYTAKHLGYKTDKGKLTLNLQYLVDNKKITANNHIFLDQFTLGDAVDSPDAVSLPIHLALALLKNRNGEITLDIPVQGNLDDPDFSVGGVVVKVLFNLIAKAVTSPFALLGALIPDGEDLHYIQFKPGQATIQPDDFDKLSQIASVLYERPGLRLDIIGKVDPEKDADAIKELHFQNLLKRQKAEDQLSFFDRNKAVSVDKVVISDEEYPRYLAMVYLEILDKKDTRPAGVKTLSRLTAFVKGDSPEKTASDQEMKAYILSDISVTDEDLRLLAQNREAKVKQYLIDSGKVEAERLFLIEPKIATSQTDESSNSDTDDVAMQVELVIK